MPIDWAFGQGRPAKRTSIRHDGQWYESRVSYFSALRGLDVTMGQQSITPHNLEEAAGRLAPDHRRCSRCFDCHATNVAQDLSLANLAGMTRRHPVRTLSWLGGRASHGPHGSADAQKSSARSATEETVGLLRAVSSHLVADRRQRTARKSRTSASSPIASPAASATTQPTAASAAPPATIRIAQLDTFAATYDAKCQLPCSLRQAGGTARVCRVASKNCVTCHMPQLELPGAHQNSPTTESEL